MKEIRILFTGAGRRVELLQAFSGAAEHMNRKLRLYGADCADTAPALSFCDETQIVCRMQEETYIPQLLDICLRENIDLLIPTIDTDLMILSKNSGRFHAIGTKVLISSPDKIAVCRDKYKTAVFFGRCGLAAPRVFTDYRWYDGGFPCFVKPRDGSSSRNAFKVDTQEELPVYCKRAGDYIIQPFIDGTEYTVDIFCDFGGAPVFITPRIRLAVREGEVLKTEIIMDQRIIEESRRLLRNLKPCGPVTLQLIRENGTGTDYFIEMNPRFGGGAALSMKAGARSAEALIKIWEGETVPYSDPAEDGAVYSRFDQSVRIVSGIRREPIQGVIFDLDDTLYSEKQYVRSGYKAIGTALGDERLADRLWELFNQGKAEIDTLLFELGREDKKEECLSIYREHMPELSLYPGADAVLERMGSMGIKTGIITDGRVNGQKNKIKALGLTRRVSDIIITDELGGVSFRKPNDIAFRIMQRRWGIPFEQMVYVGDNPQKDFRAPGRLGMRSIYFRNPDSLYGAPVVAGDLETITDILDVMRYLDPQ